MKLFKYSLLLLSLTIGNIHAFPGWAALCSKAQHIAQSTTLKKTAIISAGIIGASILTNVGILVAARCGNKCARELDVTLGLSASLTKLFIKTVN